MSHKITKDTASSLITILDRNGLDVAIKKNITEQFIPYLDELNQLKDQVLDIRVTSIEQVDEMKAAKQARLLLRKIRTSADKTRKDLKEDSLKYGRAVQEVYNAIEGQITPLEDYLREQEEYVERMEAERISKMVRERQAQIAQYASFAPQPDQVIAAMTDEAFAMLKAGIEAQYQEHLRKQAEAEAAAKAEAERVAKLEAELAEQRRKEAEQAQAIAMERHKAEQALAEERRKAEQALAEERAKAYAAAQEAARLESEAHAAALREQQLRQEVAQRNADIKARYADCADLLRGLNQREKFIDQVTKEVNMMTHRTAEALASAYVQAIAQVLEAASK